jgi:hypothetical protein
MQAPLMVTHLLALVAVVVAVVAAIVEGKGKLVAVCKGNHKGTVAAAAAVGASYCCKDTFHVDFALLLLHFHFHFAVAVVDPATSTQYPLLPLPLLLALQQEGELLP